MKKLLCCFLSAILLFGCAPCAFAEDTGCGCGRNPVVWVDGINACDLIRDAGTENERVAFPFEASGVLDLIKDNKEAVLDLADGRWSAESEQQVVDAICGGLLGDIEMTPDGESLHDVTPDWHEPTDDRHLSGAYYGIQFDWRLDPYVNAEILARFIDRVRAITGHDKVDIVAHSLGCTVLNTYLTVYGTGKVGGAIWNTGAHGGDVLVDRIYTGQLEVDARALSDYLSEMTPDDFLYQVLSLVMQGLTDVGAAGLVMKHVNTILARLCADGGFREVLLRSFGRMPGVWALLTAEGFEQAKAYVFPTEADRAENAGLIAKIDRYQNEIRLHSAEIMENAKRELGKVAVISRYGFRLTPIVAGSDVMSDSVIDSFHTSCGATFAPFDERLASGGRLSPDRRVDASTALWPDQTWFLRDVVHQATPGGMPELIRFIFDFDGQASVDSDPAFPQFMVKNADGAIVPLTGDGPAPAKLAARIRAFFLRVRDFFREVFSFLRR